MALTTKKQLAPVKPNVNCFGYGNNKKFLVIHQTGNSSVGANAAMHAKLQSNGWGASWHYSVDDKEAIQSFEHSVSCWHASDGMGDGNMNSIAIEGCINADGDYVQSVKNMAELAAKILLDEKIPLENMKQHYDFARDKKNCPTQIRAGKDGIDWDKFVSMVKVHLEPTIADEKVLQPYLKRGEFKTLKVGDTVTIREGAKRWINKNFKQAEPMVKDFTGVKDEVVEVKAVKIGYSDYAYRLQKLKVWVLEQDLEEPRKSYYRVQTGAFSNADNAKKRAEELKKQGVDTYIVKD